MKSGIGDIIGKTISEVVVTEKRNSPRTQIFLVFRDDSYLEIYGDSFSCAGGLDKGGSSDAIKYAQNMGAEVVETYPGSVELTGEEIKAEIVELIELQEMAINNQPKKLLLAFKNNRDAIIEGIPANWELKEGESSLDYDVIQMIKIYMTTSSFISAWYHLKGEKENRDKAAHSCASLISALGVPPEVVMRKYIEAEKSWRKVVND